MMSKEYSWQQYSAEAAILANQVEINIKVAFSSSPPPPQIIVSLISFSLFSAAQ